MPEYTSECLCVRISFSLFFGRGLHEAITNAAIKVRKLKPGVPQVKTYQSVNVPLFDDQLLLLEVISCYIGG